MIDRIGRKKSYAIGSVIMSVLPLVYLLFQGELSGFYAPLVFVRILHGVGLAICFTSAFTYIGDIVPESRLNEGIGIFGVTGLMGQAIGPLMGEIMIRNFGFSTFFVCATGIACVGLLLLLPVSESYAQSSTVSTQTFSSLLLKKKFLSVAILATLFGFALSAYSNFVSPYAKELNLPFISLYYMSYSLAAAMTRIAGGGRLTDRIGENRIIPYALVLGGTGLFILMFLKGTGILILSGLMSGCAHGFLFPALNSLAIRDEPGNIRGKITGVFTGGLDAGSFAGSIILGYIGEWVGFRAIFFAAGIILLAGLGFYKSGIASRKQQAG
jgi:MFS family permease